MAKRYLEKYKLMPVQVKASFWFLICSFLQRGISVITTPIFTRLMPTGAYGQYNVFNSWLDIIAIFVTLRLYFGVFVQGLVKNEEDQAAYASSMQGLNFLLCAVWTIIYLAFHDFWNSLLKLTTVQMLAMLVMIWSTGAFHFWAATQRNRFKYRMLVIVTLAVSILKPALGIIFVILAEDKVTARILGLAIAEFAGYSGLFFIQMKRGKRFYSARYWKHAIMFNIPLIPHYLSQTVLNGADKIMIERMVGASEAGIYGLAYSVSKIMGLFNQALTQTLTPWMYQKMKVNRAKDIESIAYPALIGIASVNLILIAFAPEVIAVFAPPAYYDAIWVIPPVAMSVYFTFSYNIFACFEFYYEKTGFILTASIAGAVLNIVLNYIFMQIFGYYAAGYTTLVCYMVYAIGHYFFMQRVCIECLDGLRMYDIKKLSLITGMFLACGFCLLLSYDNILLRYGLILTMAAFLVRKRDTVRHYIKQFLNIRKQRKKKAGTEQKDQT